MAGIQPDGITVEVPLDSTFIPPSVHSTPILSGKSYTHHSPLPPALTTNPPTECVLGIDEAGRGPILGPMVYSAFYLPLPLHQSLLSSPAHKFSDSKILTPETRSSLMSTLCTPSSALYESCGWSTRVLSAQDISSGMLRPHGGMYNLNAQAMDATIVLIKEIHAMGVNITEVYIDTVGKPETYQKKLERVFPTMRITVAKKADSLYACVSAASVCAKVTRDAGLKVCWEERLRQLREEGVDEEEIESWGSGYPDGKTMAWMRKNMDPLFGWGNECRFSWAPAKDMLEDKGKGVKVDWPEPEDEMVGMRLTDFYPGNGNDAVATADDELASWFGRPTPESVF